MIRLFQGVLPLEFESTLSVVVEQKFAPSNVNRSDKLLNLHWHNSFPTEGEEDMPLLAPYNDPLPKELIPFSDRRKGLFHYGIHCYEYDYKIDPAWNNPPQVANCLRKYACVTAPDYSVFVDQPRAVNVWNVYRNRWVSSYWQKEGIRLVPSASWGNVDSFDFCFDGLPENSTIAIGHVAIGRDMDARILFRLGVKTLIERKHPTRLVVYGAPLDFDPGVEVVFYEGFLQKLRRECRK